MCSSDLGWYHCRLQIVQVIDVMRRNPEERGKGAWNAWWVWAIPMGFATELLTLLAEGSRYSGHPHVGDAVDAVKLLIYLFWLRAGWRLSRQMKSPVLRPLSQALVASAVGLLAITV